MVDTIARIIDVVDTYKEVFTLGFVCTTFKNVFMREFLEHAQKYESTRKSARFDICSSSFLSLEKQHDWILYHIVSLQMFGLRSG